VTAVGSCVSGSLVAARVRGWCTVLVIKPGAVALADFQSWRIQSRTREFPSAIVMLTLCRNPDFFLRASQPEPPASSSFSRSFSKYGLTTVEQNLVGLSTHHWSSILTMEH
jgi:hypothetical protein